MAGDHTARTGIMQQDAPPSHAHAKPWDAVLIFAAIPEGLVILLAVLAHVLRIGIADPVTEGKLFLPIIVYGSAVTAICTVGFGGGLLLWRGLVRRAGRRLYVLAGVAGVATLIAAPFCGAVVGTPVTLLQEYINTTFHFENDSLHRALSIGFRVGYWTIAVSAMLALSGLVAVLSLVLSKRRDS